MRTDGSLTKAPGVVCRPVQSISWRSIIRIGETVVVPIGCSLTRCGISEPVTKIARCSTFCFRSEVWLVVGSASAVPASMLAATRVATLEDIRTLTNKPTPGKVRGANYRNDDDDPFHKSKRGNGCCHYLSADQTKTSVLKFLR